MSPWTEDFTNLIVRRYLRGDGCSELAKEFGLTRNQVLAKLSRIGVARRKPPSPPKPARSPVAARTAVPMKRGAGFALPMYGGPANTPPLQKALDAIRANKAAKADPPPQIALRAAWRPLEGVEPVPFISRTGHQCHWPVGGFGADMLCCGAYTTETYCRPHTRLAQVGAPTRDRLDERLGVILPRPRRAA